nr:alpha/beta hydrolase family protein [Halocatena marina]
MLGLTTIERTCGGEPSFQPLDVEQRSGFEQQKWIARTEPEFTVPFYVLLPENREPPYPTVFTVHGHTELGKELAVGRSKIAVQRSLRSVRRCRPVLLLLHLRRFDSGYRALRM